MPSAYAAADLAVCRSGAMTLAELQTAALPAILAPFPHAAGNHQLHNALAYVKSGGAMVIEDKDLSGNRLLTTIKNLLGDPERLANMRRALAAVPKQDTAEQIAEELLKATQS
jgi:UDP-N-acetylglucosamine--N-acetylmuramyl-(pentapeptide) pyrophosphoryl-undecaprenol N-acetylglucosamine transferase